MVTILVAEDNCEVREMLEMLLTREGYRVIATSNGAEALLLAKHEKPDLVITDVLMPITDGYEFIRLLHEEPALAQIPVIFYTATYLEPDALTLARDCGVFQVVSKPASREVLLRAIHEALQSSVLSPTAMLPSETFHRQHQQLLTDKLAKHVLALEHEIEERKQVEEALHQTQDRLNGILNSLDNVIWSVEPITFKVLYMSPATEKVFGYPASAFYANPYLWTELLHPDDREVMLNKARNYSPERKESEYRIIRPDGEVRWLHVQSRVVFDAHGVPISVDGILTDITEKKRIQEQNERQIAQLIALRAIDAAISSTNDLCATLSIVLEWVVSLLGIHAADILLLNPQTQTLEYASGQGFQTHHIQRTQLRVGQGLAGRVAQERRLLHIPSLRHLDDAFGQTELIEAEEVVGYCAIPLLAKGKVKGVLEIFHRDALPSNSEWMQLLQLLAGQAAIAIDNATLFDGLERSNAELRVAYDATLTGWSKALDLRDRETEGHTERVTAMAVRLARAIGMSDAERAQIRRGALLHDVGKLGIPDKILLKDGPLTPEEWEIMRQHPVYAYEWLSPIAYLQPALDIPYCHHEKWDGSGYPRGLKGEQIPLAARVFAVVDVWDAVLSDRPYRKGWPIETVCQHIRSLSGTHFDPRIVEVFLQLLAEEGMCKPLQV